MISLIGEVGGGGLLVYALGAESSARDAISAAAFSMFDETLGLVIGLLLIDGLSGSGGGALSGSELSHLPRRSIKALREERISPTSVPKTDHSLRMCGGALPASSQLCPAIHPAWTTELSTWSVR